MAQDLKISELIQINEYDSSAVVPVVIDEGNGVLINRKIALTDIAGKNLEAGNGIDITNNIVSVDTNELDMITKTQADAKFLTGETDPVFNASVAKNITSGNISTWNGKQDQLQSGTNIKTINGNSVLGSGNIVITAEGSIAPGFGINISETNEISVKKSDLDTSYEPTKGTDDNYVTDAEKIAIGNLSGVNTGDQDLTGLLTKTGASATYAVINHNHTGVYQPVMGSDDNYVTDTEKVNVSNLSGVNTGDETATSIKTKLGISTLSGSNTGDQDLTPYLTKTGATALYITGETDPIFNASVAKTIVSGDITNWNNKVSQEAGKSLISNTEISKLAVYPILSGTTSQFVRGDGALGEVLIGSGGYAANIYLNAGNSTINPSVYKMSYINDLTTSEISASAVNGNTLIRKYLFDSPIGATQIDAGTWTISTMTKVDSTAGNTRIMAQVYRRTSGGTESDLFTMYSPSIENTSYQYLRFENVQNYYIVDKSDYIGVKLYITTDSLASKTLSMQLGDSTATYLNTPITIRHSQLRDPNEDPNVQHMTATEKSAVDSLSSTYQPIMGSDDNYVTDAEKVKLSNLSGVNTGDQDLTVYLPKSGGTVTGNINIVGDLTVTGTTYKTNVETINVKSDYITLRDGAVSGLGAGSYTGIEAVKYDGINNGRLAFDNAGIAKVGDVGSEQPIATREETPIANGLATWNAASLKFVTSSNLIYDGSLKVGGTTVSLSDHNHNGVYLPNSATIAAGNAITVSGALNGTGVTINHADTSTASSISWANTGTTVLAGITTSVDTYGHVTSTSTSTKNLADFFVLKTDQVSSSVMTPWIKITGATRTDNDTFVAAGQNLSNIVRKGVVINWTESGAQKFAIVQSSSFSTDTTIDFVGDTMASIDTNSMRYLVNPPLKEKFVIAGTIGSTGTNVTNAFVAFESYYVIGADLYVGTAGTTNNTTIDINKNGTTMFTTKPTLATTVAYSANTFKADNASTITTGDRVTIDIDAVQTTPAVDLYVNLYLLPLRYIYM